MRQRSLCCPLRKCRRKFLVWERKWEMPLESPLCASQSYRLQSCHQNTPLHCWDSDGNQSGSRAHTACKDETFQNQLSGNAKLTIFFIPFPFIFQRSSLYTLNTVQKFNCFLKHLLHKSWHMAKKPHVYATTNAQNLFMIIKRFTS